MRTRSAVQSLLLAALLTAVAALVGSGPASAGTSREARLLEKINDARVSHGQRPLRTSPDLMAAAESHSRSMASSRLLFHTASFTSLCCWSSIAENVGYGGTVRALHRQFMRSAPHRANILDRGMRQVGVGIVARDGQLWVTEVFRQPT